LTSANLGGLLASNSYGREYIARVLCCVTGRNMTVNGLTPGVSYTFYLAAGNAVGVGTAVKFRVRTPRRVSLNEQSGNE